MESRTRDLGPEFHVQVTKWRVLQFKLYDGGNKWSGHNNGSETKPDAERRNERA